MSRIVIVGGPRTGKTTLAKSMGGNVRHTDDVLDMGWSEASEHVSHWFDEPGPWVIEGVSTARALRKWLATHPSGKPCDEVRVIDRPFTERSQGQRSMAKGVTTVWTEIAGELAGRGVEIR